MGSQIRVIQVEEAEPPVTEKPDWSFLREEDRRDVPPTPIETPASVD